MRSDFVAPHLVWKGFSNTDDFESTAKISTIVKKAMTHFTNDNMKQNWKFRKYAAHLKRHNDVNKD